MTNHLDHLGPIDFGDIDIRKLIDEVGVPDPVLLDGSTWDLKRYQALVDKRVHLRQELALRDIGITREDFDLASRLLNDDALRTRVEALLARGDLPAIIERLISIDSEERIVETSWINDRISRCQRCGHTDAQWHDIRYRRRLCERCAAYLTKCQRTSSANIGPALSTSRHHKLPATLTLDEWALTIGNFNDRCAYCDRDWDIVEHVTPTDRGGGTTFANCLPACHSCNRFKGSKTIEEWIAENEEGGPGRVIEDGIARHRRARDWLVKNGRRAGDYR